MLVTIKISLNIQKDKLAYRFRLKATILASFQSENLSLTLINLHLPKRSTLVIAQFTTCTRIGITLQTSVKFLRAITMCSTSTPGCQYDKSNRKCIGIIYRPNKKCSGTQCVHKKTFQPLERSVYEYPHCESTCQVRKILFEKQTSSFFLKYGQVIPFFGKKQKSNQDFLVKVFCDGRNNSRQKCVHVHTWKKMVKVVINVCTAKRSATF